MNISVVIPVYNTKRKYLSKCVNSVFSQTVKPDEVIIVDDGSTRQETLDFLKEQKSVEKIRVRIIRQENKGISGALNTGIKAMTGDWWAGIASDDEWLPLKLEEQIKCLVDNPGAKIVYSDWIRKDEDKNTIGIISEMRFSSLKKQQEYLKEGYFANWSGWLIKKEVFDKIGVFNESYKLNEDYEFIVRASKHYMFYKAPFALFIYRSHSEQITNTTKLGCKYILMAQDLAKELFKGVEVDDKVKCDNTVL